MDYHFSGRNISSAECHFRLLTDVSIDENVRCGAWKTLMTFTKNRGMALVSGHFFTNVIGVSDSMGR